MTTIGYYETVANWCVGANLTFGTCAFAQCGNHHCVVTNFNGNEEIMSDGEIEAMDNAITGFMPTDPNSDHGAAIQTVLQYWQTNGWVGDPTLKPVKWSVVSFDEIKDTIRQYSGCYAWFMLPHSPDGVNYDFTDVAINSNAPGVGAHAMFIAGADDNSFKVITWGTMQTVSDAWMQQYGKGFFAVQHPEWTMVA